MSGSQINISLWIEAPFTVEDATYIAGDFAKDLARRTIQANVAVASVTVDEVNRDEVRALDPEFQKDVHDEAKPKAKPRKSVKKSDPTSDDPVKYEPTATPTSDEKPLTVEERREAGEPDAQPQEPVAEKPKARRAR